MAIEKSTLIFLKELASNNQREWFEANRKRYLQAKENVVATISDIITGAVRFDPALKTIDAKDTIFRINRDVRFSKNKDPYKTNFASVISPGGRKSPGAGFYFHLEPGGKTIAGGGVWMPEPAQLAAIRQEIDYNLTEFEAILTSKAFVKTYGALSDETIKTKPKGYHADNPALPYLKQKSFVAFHSFSDKEVLAAGFTDACVSAFAAIQPLNAFLNRAQI
jgi:uncharacterized protein (TIGR02453 family)